MKPMETLQDLIEEAKSRTICWAICIFAISCFLSHTSKSMWVNIPISALILVAFRYLSYVVELHWRVRPAPKPTYLLHLEKKQLSLDDSRLSTVVSSSRWKRKIDSPPVEAAVEGFIDKILQDFVVDLWYSSITPDKEVPELIRSLILDVLGEVSGRVRGINLVDLLTRNLVDLVGTQLDLYRKNQSEIGVEVMGTLSSEERDERLKHQLIASKELHPALFSPESEQKVLQHVVGGVLALVLKPRDAQCPLVRCICRELLTCLVMQPVMNFASPWYINELIEYMFLNKSVETSADKSNNSANLSHGRNNSDYNLQSDHVERQISASNVNQLALVKTGNEKSVDGLEYDHEEKIRKDYVPKQAEWAMVLDAATKRRSEVLAPENLENMWTKGRNYQKKTAKIIKAGGLSSSTNMTPSSNNAAHTGSTGKELVTDMSETIKGIDEKYMVHLMQGSGNNEQKSSFDMVKKQNKETFHHSEKGEENAKSPSRNVKFQIKRSSSTSDLDTTFMKRNDTSSSKEDYDPNHAKFEKEQSSEFASHSEENLHVPKIKCRVIGAYFEKLGSKSFAVYSIAVTDAENMAWSVKRRYRNFEQLHRNLKDIPNYSLHLPPKRFLSSSIDDYFVHQRCILLDKYLQELLSIANIAEQHEVWDFLSESSKNYSFGKSTSVMKTLTVNVDDAMDDIVRQFKGVSDGLRSKVVGPSASNSSISSVAEKGLTVSWNEEELHKQISGLREMESSHSLSDEEVHDDDSSNTVRSGWHSDNELNSKSFPPRIVNHGEKTSRLESQRSTQSERNDRIDLDASKSPVITDFQDPVGMPPEWAPANVSVPLLNLVDKVFQLNRRGWLRRQVYWMSKQVLQLMMEDAIDDWILRQIHLLRRDDVVAQGILWIQNVLWPNGKFFKELESSQRKQDDNMPSQRPSQSTSRLNGDSAHVTSSFELQLEAARRASDVKKMILGGAPTALVSLIGPSQYKRSAKDIYYFLQSTICIKQLAYSMLELVLVTIFPELRDLMIDIHEKACYQNL